MHWLKPIPFLPALAAATLLALSGCVSPPGGDGQQGRRTAWAASHNVAEEPPGLANSSYRMVLRPSAGGDTVRVRLENTVAKGTVRFSAAYLGLTAEGAAVVPDSQRRLSFNGQATLDLAPGARAWSDPVKMPVQAFSKLSLSLHVEAATDVSTHTLALTTNYRADGNRAASPSADGYSAVPPMAKGVNLLAFPVYWVGALEVTPRGPGAIVALGDSITDGRCSSTTNGGLIHGGVVVPDVHLRWTDLLATRLAALEPARRKSVVNAGIAGNQVVKGGNGPSALERLDRDVLELAGVTHVIFFEGTNDIASGRDAATLIDGIKQVLVRLRAKGIKVIGATAIARGKPGTGFSAAQEKIRLDVNQWMRQQAGFDGLIDFDALLAGGGRSETGAEIIKAEYNCDHIHPNAAGYEAMGRAINLDLFKD